MTDEDDDYKPRHVDEIPEDELVEMMRMCIDQVLRSDIAERALALFDAKWAPNTDALAPASAGVFPSPACC